MEVRTVIQGQQRHFRHLLWPHGRGDPLMSARYLGDALAAEARTYVPL
jgi:hypothetical protein